VYTEDFPVKPPHPYNYTNRELIPPGPLEEALEPTFKATKLRRFKYNTTVEIVFQSTALLQSDSNPMHLHGYDFFVLAQGLGNFDPKRDVAKFNYHNPQLRNTVQVPRTGWAAIRFVTDNPGITTGPSFFLFFYFLNQYSTSADTYTCTYTYRNKCKHI
jgi:laccase